MQCRTCEYTLWEIRDRVCPECGEPFLPSQYRFTPNTVRFRCPHCDQQYFGTDGDGHLQPRAFRCVQCAADIHMDEMVLAPLDNVAEEVVTLGEKNPWERRRGLGFFRAWIQTIGWAMFRPVTLIRKTSPDASVRSALWFAIFSNGVYTTIGFISSLLTASILLMALSGSIGLLSVGAIVIQFVAGVILIFPLMLLLWALFTHGALLVSGGAHHPFRRTLVILCYSSGAYALRAIPVIGSYLTPLAWLWWAISAIIMLREGQRVAGPRAAGAVLVVPLLGFAGIAAWLYAVLSPLMAPTQRLGLLQSQTQVVTTAIVNAANAGDPPAHGASLITKGYLTMWDFVVADSLTIPEDIAFGPVTFANLDPADIITSRRAVEQLNAMLPSDVVAHRVGDFVMTYHGVDVTDPATAELWIVIAWPDPDFNRTQSPSAEVIIGSASGSVVSIPSQMFDLQLKAQNQSRAMHHLPPLPHPSTVTTANPAVVVEPDASAPPASE